jgi:hypothetical protein
MEVALAIAVNATLRRAMTLIAPWREKVETLAAFADVQEAEAEEFPTRSRSFDLGEPRL